MSKKQILTLILVIVLIFTLPVSILLIQKRQDIRPRASQGTVNLLLSADTTNTTVGKDINVIVSLQLVTSTAKVSAVDFVLLYDRNRLEAINLVPNITATNANSIFTGAPVIMRGGTFPDDVESGFGFVRTVLLVRRPNDYLFPYPPASPPVSTVLATITFRAKGTGDAVIKFPENNKYIQIVGMSIGGAGNMIPEHLEDITPTSETTINITSTLEPTSKQLSCKWCGLDCVDASLNKNCIMIAPPTDRMCQGSNTACITVYPTIAAGTNN